MMKSKLILTIFTGLLLMQLKASAVSAQSLLLNPAEAGKKVNEQFTVDLNIDTAGKAVAGTDIKLTFDPSILEVIEVVKGDFFTDGANSKGTDYLYVAGFFPPQFETKTGTGKVATITLKGKKDGTAALTFVCTSQTNDTNILDSSAADIINCDSLVNGSYTISEVGGPADPTPTPTPKVSVTPKPTSKLSPTATPPVSGMTLPTIFSIGVGSVLTILGLALVF